MAASRAQFWLEHIESWRAGDWTQVEYCRLHALSIHSFRAWLYRPDRQSLTRRSSSKSPDQGIAKPFIPVRVARPLEPEDQNHDSLIEVVLRGDRRILVRPGFDAATLSKLVAALETAPC